MTILSSLQAQGIHAQDITADSRQVEAGSLFLAYPGEHADGRNFIAQALAQGAAAVLWERDGFAWNSQWQTANIAVDDLRAQAGFVADEFYRHPSQKLWMVGVTGTNGKTSCSHWLAQAFHALGRKTALLGTLGNGFPNALSAAVNTTPDPILLHRMLGVYREQGAEAVAMEVSSHGLDQGRVNGVHFDVAVFTNLTRDHLDYHGDMAAYGAAKEKLLQWPGLQCAVLNADDAFGRSIADRLSEQHRQVLTYGLQHGDVRASDLHFDGQGLSMQVATPFGKTMLRASLSGRFNAYNLLAVLSTLLVSDVSLEYASDVLASIKSVPGRMQQLGGGHQPLVVIDYAHTPDALENVLSALREQVKGQLICVFGCGGNRDSGKRPLMGAVASRLADAVAVTSDNPRDENPASIIADIATGMSGNYRMEADRATAIRTAISAATAGDIVLIAGKGHEDYQEIAGIRHPFSDLAIAEQVLHGFRSAEPVLSLSKDASPATKFATDSAEGKPI